jgi:hypothetical protein
MAERRKPNVFLIGAPKCGTTALSEYLRCHPNVFFSSPKEPHFFNDDFANRYIRHVDDYMRLFSSVDEMEFVIAEGSVFYLSSTTAVQNILHFNHDAKFIVMVRNPIDAAYSWHSQAIYSFGENILDFELAWSSQAERRLGKVIPSGCRELKTLLYGPMFEMGAQLERLYGLVPPERVHVIVFDHFVSNTQGEYDRLLGFLGLPGVEGMRFPALNSNKTFRSWPVEVALRVASRAKQAIGLKVPLGIRAQVTRWNTRMERRAPMPESLRGRLKDYFRGDVTLLSELVGEDLSTWLA